MFVLQSIFSVSTKGWVACEHCGKSAHISCEGEDEEDVTSAYICVFWMKSK
jgi:hypothetical protein